jgi:protein ImuB
MLWLCIQLPRLATEAFAAGAAPATCRIPPQRAALERLAAWALQWSSHVHCRGDAAGAPDLWLELGASRRLFGGLAPLLAQIRAALVPLGYSTRSGLAPTPAGAALLARAGIETPVATLALLREQLAPLPLALLALPQAVLAACESAGIRRIGMLLELPPAALARRFGPEASLYLQRLVGLAPEPLPAWRPPDRWHARCEFTSAVDASTALLFPLQRLLHEFAGYLRATDRAVQRFSLTLEQRARPPTRLPIGLSIPGRDAVQFLRLARERLTRAAPGAAVCALILEADEFTAPVTLQSDFLAPEQAATTGLQQLLDRLCARLGEDAVCRLEVHADHRPERAWRRIPTGDPGRTGGTRQDADATAADWPPRPCWLLPQPQRIAPPSEMLAGPERIESGWWDGADAARDYYLARDAQGARLWIFRDLRDAGWYLAGLWA